MSSRNSNDSDSFIWFVIWFIILMSMISCKESVSLKPKKTVTYRYELTYLGGAKDTIDINYQVKVDDYYRLQRDDDYDNSSNPIRRQVYSCKLLSVK